MGKTAVCIALILANPMNPQHATTPNRCKATLVVTNTTLTKQWVEEIKKFAPGIYLVQID